MATRVATLVGPVWKCIVRLMPKITPSYEALLCRLNESPNEALLRVLNDRWAPLARYSYTRERIRTDSEFRVRLEAAAWTEVSFWRSLVIDERVRDDIEGLPKLYPNSKWLKIEGEHVALSLSMRRQPVARLHVRREALSEETEAVIQLRRLLETPKHRQRLRLCPRCQRIFFDESRSRRTVYCRRPACLRERDRHRQAERRRRCSTTRPSRSHSRRGWRELLPKPPQETPG
jgi:predicted RNA-binding Zn ribbon-like protein